MNDTLWKIKRQALYAAGHLGDDEYFEKIVELTVRECIDIANNVHMCRDGKVIAEDIKQHFGVEL